MGQERLFCWTAQVTKSLLVTAGLAAKGLGPGSDLNAALSWMSPSALQLPHLVKTEVE